MCEHRVPWRWSLLTAVLVSYTPFLVMALSTLAFVRCGHCKEAYAWLFPVGPGFLGAMLSYDWIKWLIDLPALPNGTDYWIAAGSSLSFVVLIAATGRLGQCWLVGTAVAAFFICGMQAVWLLAAIQA